MRKLMWTSKFGTVDKDTFKMYSRLNALIREVVECVSDVDDLWKIIGHIENIVVGVEFQYKLYKHELLDEFNKLKGKANENNKV